MEWAEEFGLGELGLLPEQFWNLTVHEFWIKHAAFSREEDRRRALIFELAVMTGQHDQKWVRQTQRGINQLRRYPIKRWLLPE